MPPGRGARRSCPLLRWNRQKKSVRPRRTRPSAISWPCPTVFPGCDVHREPRAGDREVVLARSRRCADGTARSRSRRGTTARTGSPSSRARTAVRCGPRTAWARTPRAAASSATATRRARSSRRDRARRAGAGGEEQEEGEERTPASRSAHGPAFYQNERSRVRERGSRWGAGTTPGQVVLGGAGPPRGLDRAVGALAPLADHVEHHAAVGVSEGHQDVVEEHGPAARGGQVVRLDVLESRRRRRRRR